MTAPAFVSLFSGAGGLDAGLEAAGWRCAYASDKDKSAVGTLRGNVGTALGSGRRAFEGTFLEQADVTTLSPAQVLARSALRRGDVSLLAGGPPCQSWSSAGHQLGFEDPRGKLFDDFVRIAGGLDARWLTFENVRGLLTARGPDGQPGSALAHIRRRLLDAGYQTTVALLNAADYGVPQRRVRLFVIGFRAGDAPVFPTPTHAKAPDLTTRESWLTLADAIASVAPLTPAEVIRPNARLADALALVAPGSGIRSEGKAERTRPGGHWGYRQGCFVADPEQSARTVTASSQQDWVRDPAHGVRRLSPRECAAIQGFPHDWTFAGGATTQYKLIGNAVPPPVAEAVGRSLLAHVNGEHLLRPDLNRLLPLPPRLEYHVRYTAREETSNGQSRRSAPSRRTPRAAATA